MTNERLCFQFINLWKVLLTLLFILILISNSFAQQYKFSVSQIDSIVINIDSNKNCNYIVTDGIIYKNYKKKHRKKIAGGFSIIYTSDDSSKQLLKASNNANAPFKNETKTYYYFRDSLIYISILTQDDQKKFRKNYYIFDRQIISENGTNNDFYSFDELIKESEYYQNDYKEQLDLGEGLSR